MKRSEVSINKLVEMGYIPVLYKKVDEEYVIVPADVTVSRTVIGNVVDDCRENYGVYFMDAAGMHLCVSDNIEQYIGELYPEDGLTQAKDAGYSLAIARKL